MRKEYKIRTSLDPEERKRLKKIASERGNTIIGVVDCLLRSYISENERGEREVFRKQF